MDNTYEKYTIEELTKKMEEETIKFKEYQTIINEAYEGMKICSTIYKTIEEELKKRNNGK